MTSPIPWSQVYSSNATKKKKKKDTSLKSFQNILYFIILVLFPTLPCPYCCTQSLQGYGADSILQQNR